MKICCRVEATEVARRITGTNLVTFRGNKIGIDFDRKVF